MTRPHQQAAELFLAEDLERVLARAEHDPAASQKLDFLADLVAAAELERRSIARETRPAARRKGAFLERQWLVAVAASLLFLGALTVWLLKRRPVAPRASSLAAREAPRYVAADLRTGEAALEEAFPQAMERYTSGDHAGAGAALSAWLAAHPEHGPARFYLAACREQLGALAEAAADYRAVADQQPGYLGQHARWRLANLALAREDVPGARVELRRLLESESAFGRSAAELLAKLDGR